MLRVAVGIPTFRRPERLARLLDALPARIAEVDDDVEVVVLVVDNDPEGSAAPVLAEAGLAAAGLAIRSGREPTPGIAAVRNRLLDLARDCDAIVFIDDDEVPLPDWLGALLRTWRATGAEAVMGRVVSVFEAEPDPWVLATGVFRRRPRPTGLELRAAACGSLLVDLRRLGEARVRFDESLGLAGGGRIVWCDESLAEDAVPPERTTRRWAMRRAFNGGNSAVQVELRLAAGAAERARVRASRLGGGAARAAAGWARHAWGVAAGRLEADARGLRTAYRGLGMLAAAVGHTHREYARAEHAAARPPQVAHGA